MCCRQATVRAGHSTEYFMRITELKGVGDKTEKLLNKLGIVTTDDLMTYYPRAYEAFEDPVTISDISAEGIHSIFATFVGRASVNTRTRFKTVTVKAADVNGQIIQVTWYNSPYIISQVQPGYQYVLRGKVVFKGSLVFMQQPRLYSYAEYDRLKISLQPVYKLTSGITGNALTKLIRLCFDMGVKYREYLPDKILTAYDLIDEQEAYRKIHFPENEAELMKARKRIVFDEFFMFTLYMRYLKDDNERLYNDFYITESDYSRAIRDNIGYSLTGAQERAYSDLLSDMQSGRCANRLIQGDVGSGKTIIALLAMCDAVKAGFQAVLMAPTEVLATQHYESFKKIFDKCGLNINVCLLTGSLNAAAKKAAHEDIKSHKAQIIVGTHALITDKVEYDMLGLVITDEQHRFGVRQRESLANKGASPHMIVMSATPIPRSLAIILYGDLDISVIDEKPVGRLPIKNAIVDETYHDNAVRFIANHVAAGHQAYVICAMAKPDEDDPENEDDKIKNTVDYCNQLRKELPASVRCEYLYGSMKATEKERIMGDFAAGLIDVLVSTTVVEVGVNVPNANVMLIENAERFGLASLHQLRGRVGRGSEQAYCIFSCTSKSEKAKERLAILKESNDGFEIAEADLQMRGPGDVLGERQSGDMDFKMGDIYAYRDLLSMAAGASQKLLEEDRRLTKEENATIKKKLEIYAEMKNQGGLVI